MIKAGDWVTVSNSDGFTYGKKYQVKADITGKLHLNFNYAVLYNAENCGISLTEPPEDKVVSLTKKEIIKDKEKTHNKDTGSSGSLYNRAYLLNNWLQTTF